MRITYKKLLYQHKSSMIQKSHNQPYPLKKLYKQHPAQSQIHKNNIIKVKGSNANYFTTCCRIGTSFSWKQCLLFIFEVEQKIFIGYSSQTLGFPIFEKVAPVMQEERISFQEINSIITTKDHLKIAYKRIDQHYERNYQFNFVSSLLKERWIYVLTALWYFSKKKSAVSVESIVNFGTYKISDERIVKSVQTQLSPLEKLDQNQYLVKTIQKLAQEKGKIHEILSSRDQTIKDLNKRIDDLQNQLRKNSKICMQQQNKQIQTKGKVLQLPSQQNNQAEEKFTNLISEENIALFNNSQTFQIEEQGLQKKVDYLTNLITQFQQKEREYQHEINHLKAQINNKDTELQATIQKTKRQTCQIEALPSENNNTSNSQLIQEKERQINSLKQELEQSKKQIAQLQKKIGEIQEYSREIRTLNEKNIQLEEKTNKLQLQKQEIQQKFQKQSQSILGLQQKLQLKQAQITQLKQAHTQQIQAKSQQIAELKRKKQDLCAQYNAMQANLKKEQENSSKLKKEANSKELQCCQLLEKLRQKERDFDKLKEQSDQAKYRLQDQLNLLGEQLGKSKIQYEEQIRKFKQTVSGLSTEIDEVRRQSSILILERQNSKSSIKQAEEMRNQVQNLKRMNLFHIFDGYVLEGNLQYTEFLKQSIQKYNGKKIFKTRRLYTLEKDPNANFHKQVDEIPEIAVLVKTEAGFYLAGYSQSPLSSKAPANKGGLIISLNNKKVFPLIQGKRSVTYDTFFLIIGNSEIRLKNQEWKVFSNFGIANSFFNNLNCGVNDLLGEGPAAREVKLHTFEVHKIIYE